MRELDVELCDADEGVLAVLNLDFGFSTKTPRIIYKYSLRLRIREEYEIAVYLRVHQNATTLGIRVVKKLSREV